MWLLVEWKETRNYGKLKSRNSVPKWRLLLLHCHAKLMLLNASDNTAWKVSKYGVISGPYFPVFGLNTGKYRTEITPYLDIFQAVMFNTTCAFKFFRYSTQFLIIQATLPLKKNWVPSRNCSLLTSNIELTARLDSRSTTNRLFIQTL